MSDFTKTITFGEDSYTLEYFDDEHLYLVDGVIVPSITQLLKVRFGGMYRHVPEGTLKRAAEAGTAVHEAIENYCKTGEEVDIPELRGFKFLQRNYEFEVLENEVPVILFLKDNPIAAGRLDLVLSMDGEVGGGDIKRTSVLNKDYLAYQLNLYRIAYRQCYGVEWKFLRALHLRDDKRRFVDLPINEEYAWSIVDEYMEENHV